MFVVLVRANSLEKLQLQLFIAWALPAVTLVAVAAAITSADLGRAGFLGTRPVARVLPAIPRLVDELAGVGRSTVPRTPLADVRLLDRAHDGHLGARPSTRRSIWSAYGLFVPMTLRWAARPLQLISVREAN